MGDGGAAAEHGGGAGVHGGDAAPVQAGAQHRHAPMRPHRLPQPRRHRRRRTTRLNLREVRLRCANKLPAFFLVAINREYIPANNLFCHAS